jgi:hypothetical protein
VQEFLSLTGVITLLQKHCNTKQETEECKLKLCGYIYHQGTYTHRAGTEKMQEFLPLTGVSILG